MTQAGKPTFPDNSGKINIFAVRNDREIWIRTLFVSLSLAFFTTFCTQVFFIFFLKAATVDDKLTTLLFAFLLTLFISLPIIFGFIRMYRRVDQLNTELSKRANLDGLTGLLNRSAFWAQVKDPNRLRRDNGDAILVVDIDNFKAVNDRHGHIVGDLALKMVAISLRGMVFDRDIVGRLGGEEFCVFLHGCGTHGAYIAAERIRASIEKNVIYSNSKPFYLTVSIGGALLDQYSSIDECYEAADTALFDAKRRGRNRFIMASPHAPRLAVIS